MAEFEDLQQRVELIEQQLRGEGDDEIDLRAVPLTQLKNHLEFDWLPDAAQLLQGKSITHDQIGELPSACMTMLTPTTSPFNIGMYVAYDTIEHDTANMAALIANVFGAAYSCLWCKVPGKYVVSMGGAFANPGAVAGQYNFTIMRGAVGAAAGAEVAVATQQHYMGAVAHNASAALSRIIHLQENERIVANVYQNSSAAPLGFGGAYTTFLSMTWVGA